MTMKETAILAVRLETGFVAAGSVHLIPFGIGDSTAIRIALHGPIRINNTEHVHGDCLLI